MNPRKPIRKRIDPMSAVKRDRQRLEQREDNRHSFWQSLSVIGMVGWPIVLSTLGGLFLGRYLDGDTPTGRSWTISLMLLGLGLGCMVAWMTVAPRQSSP